MNINELIEKHAYASHGGPGFVGDYERCAFRDAFTELLEIMKTPVGESIEWSHRRIHVALRELQLTNNSGKQNTPASPD
jgi:hypothetical protein